MFTRLLYYGLALFHLSYEEFWLMPFGEIMDLWECHKQYNGISKPKKNNYIDDIIPTGV